MIPDVRRNFHRESLQGGKEQRPRIRMTNVYLPMAKWRRLSIRSDPIRLLFLRFFFSLTFSLAPFAMSDRTLSSPSSRPSFSSRFALAWDHHPSRADRCVNYRRADLEAFTDRQLVRFHPPSLPLFLPRSFCLVRGCFLETASRRRRASHSRYSPTPEAHSFLFFSSIFLASDGHAGADQHDWNVYRFAESHHELHTGERAAQNTILQRFANNQEQHAQQRDSSFFSRRQNFVCLRFRRHELVVGLRIALIDLVGVYPAICSKANERTTAE